MAFTIRRTDYFYTTVKDKPGMAYSLLSQLADLGINLLAFTAVPVGPDSTQLTLFPENTANLQKQARLANLKIEGPHNAFIVTGDDEMGALAQVHRVLAQANVNIYASYGVTDGKGDYGYLIYVRPDHFEKAAKAMNV